jgi:hypothetical protein
MTKRERFRMDMFIRAVQFILNNIGDFVAGGVVAAQLVVVQAAIAKVQTLSGAQVEGFGDAGFAFNSKDTARENLREMLSEISRTARSMVYEFPGIDLKFRMPRNNNDAQLLAKALAFLTEATPLQADFERYEMDKNFLTALQTLITDFEQSLSTPGTAIDAHVAATAEISAEIRKGMVAVRTMNGAVRNKYRNDVGKLAAWLSASHIEKAPKTAPPAIPPTPPDNS